MDSKSRHWFLHTVNKAHFELGIPQLDCVLALEPIIHPATVLNQEIAVLRWHSSKANTQKEFPLFPPLEWFNDALAANPECANVWFVGPMRILEDMCFHHLNGYYARHHQKDVESSPNACMVAGEICHLRFLFQIIQIGDPNKGLLSPDLWCKFTDAPEEFEQRYI